MVFGVCQCLRVVLPRRGGYSKRVTRSERESVCGEDRAGSQSDGGGTAIERAVKHVLRRHSQEQDHDRQLARRDVHAGIPKWLPRHPCCSGCTRNRRLKVGAAVGVELRVHRIGGTYLLRRYLGRSNICRITERTCGSNLEDEERLA